MPYRPYRRVELDNILIHNQSFPRHRPLDADSVRTLVQVIDVDDVPVHQQTFPLVKESDARKAHIQSILDTQTMQDLDSDPDPEPLNELSTMDTVEPVTEPVIAAVNLPSAMDTNSSLLSEVAPSCDMSGAVDIATFTEASDPPQQSSSVASASSDQSPPHSTVPSTHLAHAVPWTGALPIRQEYKMRGKQVMVGRYLSARETAIQHPPECAQAQLGDLFIHRWGDRQIQIWLWDEQSWQPDVTDGHIHPVVQDHRLYIRDGIDPTWVTRKTRTTYRGRDRQKGNGVANGTRKSADGPNTGTQ
ncbi:hypothetical protein BJ138DRAFT_1117160 [Hygrophoropsis aurantiaca]|uniref:Uncharacterized protein n=1 Tax=Hygrophoropsis aurantiaca TaxID=72124 RepID=A0ACB8A0S7_9AGAM|nr:hypothetical protein BJ138DRAFT_1117160 [Hygrophoropsis aurantiaca]